MGLLNKLFTPGGNMYLANTSTFALLYEYFKQEAENRDTIDAGFQAGINSKVPLVRQVDTNVDLNVFVGSAYEGVWSMGSTTRAATVSNKPPGALQGSLLVTGGTGYQTFYEYVSGQVGKIWVRNVVATVGPSWSAWTQLFPPLAQDQKYSAGTGALGYQVRQDFARRRMAGGIGTGGRAAVALRFDDNPRKFLDVVLPVLQANDLPGYIASAVRYYDETAAPFTEVQTAALNNGVEIANHSWTHADASGDQAIYDNTVAAADYLEQQMPSVLVNTWTMPSLSGTKMDGYDDGRYISNFTSTTAGRLIMSRHSAVNGYSGGRTHALDGNPSVGQTHLTIETMTLSEVQGYVGEAQRMGTGLTLMVHPSRIDTAGFMTLATFTAVMEWLAAERQAGRLLVLSAQGLAFANSDRSQRVNLCPNGDFSGGVTGWQNNTGWTFDPTAGTATTTTGTPLYQNIVFSPYISMRGATCELVYRVKGASGDVVRTAVSCSPTVTTKDHTLTDADWVEVRKTFTIPAGFATDGVIRVDVGRVSGGSVTVRDVRVQAV